MKTTAVPIARHGAKQQPAAGALGTVAVAVVSALSSIHWKDLKINNKQSGKRVSFFHFVTTWVSEERKNTRETQLCKKKNISQWRWSGKVFNFLHESRAHTIKKKRKQRTYIKKRKKYSMGLWESSEKKERDEHFPCLESEFHGNIDYLNAIHWRTLPTSIRGCFARS